MRSRAECAERAHGDLGALAWGGVANVNGYLVRRATAEGGPNVSMAYVETPGYAESNLTAGAAYVYRVAAVNGSRVSADSAAAEVTTLTPLVIPCFASRADGGAAVACGAGTVTLLLSGALDPRLELVCSDSLTVPIAQWQPVSDAAISDADADTGAVTVSLATDAPRLFFTVRVK